jgi:outer membrane protein TolC
MTFSIPRFCAVAGAILLLNGYGGAQDTLRLRDAVIFALSNNPELRAMQYDRQISSNNVAPARAGIGPRIVANHQLYYGYGDATIATAGEGPPLEFTDNRHGISIRPEANWVVFDNGRGRARLDKLRALDTSTGLRIAGERERTVAEVTRTYLRAARLRRQLDLAAENIELTAERLARAERDARYGGSTTLRRLQARVDLNQDSVAYRNLALELANAKRQLNQLLGRDPATRFALEQAPPLASPLSRRLLYDRLMASNATLSVARQRLDLLLTDLVIAERAKGPTVQLYTAGVYQNVTDNTSFLQEQRYLGAEAGIRTSIDLYDGGLRKLDRQNARLRLEQGRRQLENTELQLATTFQQQYATYRNNLQQLRYERDNLATFELNYRKSREDYRKSREDYRLGQVDGTVVRTAQVNLNEARTRIALREFGVRQSEVNLLLLSGGLLK